MGLTQAWMLHPGLQWVPAKVRILSAAFAVHGIPVDTPSSTTRDLKLPPTPCPPPPGLRYLQWPQKPGTLCGCHPPCLASKCLSPGGPPRITRLPPHLPPHHPRKGLPAPPGVRTVPSTPGLLFLFPPSLSLSFQPQTTELHPFTAQAPGI